MEGAVVEVLTTTPQGGFYPKPIAFLDRDGVINIGSPNYINSPDELVLLEGAAAAIGQLKRNGYHICIVTNQSAISRGLWGPKQIEKIHQKMQEMILEIDNDAVIDLIITCPHRQMDRCNCRKPMPGMLYLGESYFRHNLVLNKGLNIDVKIPNEAVKVNWWKDKPQASNEHDLIVGDRKSDLGAGWARGIRLFKVNPNLGLAQVVSRAINQQDKGDNFQPVR